MTDVDLVVKLLAQIETYVRELRTLRQPERIAGILPARGQRDEGPLL